MPPQPSISNWMTMDNPQGGDLFADTLGSPACGGGDSSQTLEPSFSCLPNPMDPDENDVGPRLYDVFDASPTPIPQARKSDSTPTGDSSNGMRNDTAGHLPQQVENDIADLGKLLSLMQPQDVARAHEFGPTLEEYAVDGVPVDCGNNWSRETIEAAIRQGPHQSAMTEKAWELFKDDIAYQVKAGFSRVVLWDDIKDNLPPQLKISPVAVVPQSNRRDRIILDLSFPVRVGREIIQQAVNATTVSTSHPSALKYLGSSMPRILQFMAHAPSTLPIFFSKYDVSDGFWRMVVAAGAEWNFAYVLPQPPGEPLKLVVPNALQMGWKESPGYFCSASETARDVIEQLATSKAELPMHKFEQYINTVAPPSTAGTSLDDREVPWTALEVFVDDFIAMTQNVSRIQHLTRSILHGIEEVFPSIEVTGHVAGREPVSEKKVKRGEANWEVTKDVLGWLVDGDNRTVQLTPDKAKAYGDELKKLLRKKKIPLARFRKIVGKLRFAALCLPAGRALMTPLNMAMRGKPRDIGSGKHSEVHESLGDWLQLIKSLASRPTSVHELVAKSIDFYGYCDACKTGAGGVWLPFNTDLDPFIWRVQWPKDIVQQLGDYEGISISDAECAGVLLQQFALECQVDDLVHKKALPFCDNTPAVSWVTRMASKQSRIGGRLAKGIAIRARTRRMCLPAALSVAGDDNKMADVASRSFNAASGYLFSDAELLTHFAANFPLQNRSWRVVTLPHEDILKVVSTLRGKRLTMAQWMTPDAGSTGRTGADSAHAGECPRTSQGSPKQCKPTSSAPLLSGSAKATTDEATKSLLKLSTKLSAPLGRPSNWLEGPTQPRSLADASASFN